MDLFHHTCQICMPLRPHRLSVFIISISSSGAAVRDPEYVRLLDLDILDGHTLRVDVHENRRQRRAW